MQRWRVLSYVAVASAVLAAPVWLLAQEAAKPAACGACSGGRRPPSRSP